MPAHALITSLAEATKLALWMLKHEERIPDTTQAYNRIETFKISGRRTLIFHDTFAHPHAEVFAYDHPHCMGKAIQATSALGFLLRDLNHEFTSRFSDNLALLDKKVKTIGSTLIANRANLGATIGEGNKHIHKYSMLGHVYLLAQIAIEEITRGYECILHTNQNAVFQEKLMKPISYKQLNLFNGEISPNKLAATARKTIKQFNNDYRLCSFCYLVEWRARKEMVEMACCQTPQPEEYKMIIDDDNCFKPCITKSMKQNSTDLNTHLKAILQLREHPQLNDNAEENDEYYLTDSEILHHAMQHKIPLTVSIDGISTNME
jgi:hypothetical protein